VVHQPADSCFASQLDFRPAEICFSGTGWTASLIPQL